MILKLYNELDANIKYFENAFDNCGDLVKRKFPIGRNLDRWLYVAYFDLLIDRNSFEANILTKLMLGLRGPVGIDELDGDIFETLKDVGFTTADLKEETDFTAVTDAVLSGDTAVMVDGYDRAIVVSSKEWPNRGVPAAETEAVVQGSKEAFTEVFRFNTVLIRRRIRDTGLKVEQMRIGTKSGTDVALMYLDGIVRPSVLDETRKRLGKINIDAILDAGYIDQLISDDWKSPFPQTQITERPDKAAAAVLEGRIIIVADNSPFVAIVPATLNTFFQSSEDYCQHFGIMSFTRALRWISAFLAVALPGMYITLAIYHPSMLPMELAYKLSAARKNVPFPAVLEILIMDIAFELIREAGLRLPGAVGGTIGIVGGLIVGQAAVEAGIVSPIVVIIIALTGIAGFAIPHYSLSSGFRIMKYLIIFLSAFIGLLGFLASGLLIMIHLVSLKSFGIPYMFPYTAGEMNGMSDFKDTIFRMPLLKMKKRPIFARPEAQIRFK